jgi:hypothetical protein
VLGDGNFRSHSFQYVFRIVTARSAVHRHRRLERTGCLHLYGWSLFSSLPLFFKWCWDCSIFTGPTQVAFDLMLVLHIWPDGGATHLKWWFLWRQPGSLAHVRRRFGGTCSPMFQRLQLWKNERIGSFIVLWCPDGGWRGCRRGVLSMMSWSDVGLFYCASFLTVFFHRGPETANKYPSLTSVW